MTNEIALTRCRNQLLAGDHGTSASEIVEWFGAMQAQDFGAALWAIGQRSNSLTATEVERAIADRQIVRTWPLRGTIHFVPAADVRWMLALTGARQNERSWSVLRSVGLDQAILNRGRSILEAALRDGPLTRPEIYAAFDTAGLALRKGAGLHIIGYWAQAGLICFGAHRLSQPTFALLDDWLAGTRHNTLDQGTAHRTLATRYFQSRAPATDRDFAWWSGLPLTVAREAIRLADDLLEERRLDGCSMWMHRFRSPWKSDDGNLLRLLSPFDEILVAYKDRSACDRHPGIQDPALSFFGPTICANGRLVGTWKKVVGPKTARVQLVIAPDVGRLDAQLIKQELARLSLFWGRMFDLAE
ncbi:winged helix DNA-binding domain-containing protein [Tabrizicola sp.]|uniref:winged helix DNA-binding domain-containing protein n=1 Tax=Tabrizicola sp. TaxID=2005166 RepID=UPI0035B25B04